MKVYHPYTPLESLLYLLKTRLSEADLPKYELIQKEAPILMRACYFDETLLIYPHTYLAAGCFSVACEKHGVNTVDMLSEQGLAINEGEFETIKAIFRKEVSKFIDKERALRGKEKIKKLFQVKSHTSHSSSKTADFKKPLEKERPDKSANTAAEPKPPT